MQRINISHVTEYRFPCPVSLQPHRLLLRPRANHNVRIESSRLEIVPAHTLQWKRDVLDNSVAVASFSAPADRVCVASNVIIQHYEDNPFDFLVDDYAVYHPFEYAPADRVDLEPFLQVLYPDDGPAVQGWLHGLGLPGGLPGGLGGGQLGERAGGQPIETFALLDLLNRAIAAGFQYQMREAPGVQSPARTLMLNQGSCRDFAALLMEACHHLGLASRFVSGYLHCPGSDQGDAATHAWTEVYLPGAGWKGFDPTSGEVTGNRHIAVAVARHPEAVPPVAGSYLAPPDAHPVLTVAVRVSALPA